MVPPRDALSLPEAGVFLADILDNPEDDTPRLIFADWLDDQDHPWGALLRAQTWRSRLTEADPRQEEMQQIERAWLETHGEQFLEPFRGLGWRGGFRRGFLHLVAHVSTILDSGIDELARSSRWPLVEMVRIVGGGLDPLQAILPECSALAYFPGIDLMSAGLGDEGISRITMSDHLDRLRRLDLGFNQLGPEGAAAVASSGALEELRILKMDDNYLGAEGADVFAHAGGLPRLHSLDLRFNGLGPDGALNLARATTLTSLTTLYLGNNHLGDAGAQNLARAEGLPNLRTLYVEYNDIDPYYLDALRERFPNVHA